MKKVVYETNVDDIKEKLRLADKDKRIIIETEDKIVVICEIDKSKLKDSE